jgi:myo-inositol-1(or 4)-monophosphatase
MAYSLSTIELQEIYAFALDLGRRAGKILLDGVDKRTGEQSGRDNGPEEEKMNAVDIVTQADLGMFTFLNGHWSSHIWSWRLGRLGLIT